MEINPTTNAINRAITGTASVADRPLNAFGIGEANRPEVEISAQGRVLQQIDANQQELRRSIESIREARQEQEGNTPANAANGAQTGANSNNTTEAGNTGFVRLATSEGSVQRNNVTAERAAEVYRTISGLV